MNYQDKWDGYMINPFEAEEGGAVKSGSRRRTLTGQNPFKAVTITVP